MRTDSGRAVTVAGGRGSWIRDIVSPDGFADDTHVGWERSRGVGVTPAFWPESLKGDTSTERQETEQEHALKREGDMGLCLGQASFEVHTRNPEMMGRGHQIPEPGAQGRV